MWLVGEREGVSRSFFVSNDDVVLEVVPIFLGVKGDRDNKMQKSVSNYKNVDSRR